MKSAPASVKLLSALKELEQHKFYAIYFTDGSVNCVSCETHEQAAKLAKDKSGIVIHGEVLEYTKEKK